MTRTGDNSSAKLAQTLADALNRTGQFTAKPIENGCAVKVETTALRAKAPVPYATATVWLPDADLGAGYVWTSPTDHELPAWNGIDRVVAALVATLVPEEEE